MAEEELKSVHFNGEKLDPRDITDQTSGKYWKRGGEFLPIKKVGSFGDFEIEGVGKFERHGSYYVGKDKDGKEIRIEGDPSFLGK